MKQALKFLGFFVPIFGFITLSSVHVYAESSVWITGGNITLTISTATAGSEPDSVTNNTCSLDWSTNENNKKITVETDIASPTFTLKVEAVNISGTGNKVGTAVGEITLSITPQDFIERISEATASCTLKYTASATAAQGTGSDVHTITYTIL